jgi:hypothetical protein
MRLTNVIRETGSLRAHAHAGSQIDLSRFRQSPAQIAPCRNEDNCAVRVSTAN